MHRYWLLISAVIVLFLGAINLGFDRSAPARTSDVSGRMTAGAVSSGRAGDSRGRTALPSSNPDARPDCFQAKRGLRWYHAVIARYRSRIGAGARPSPAAGHSCPEIRRAAKFYRSKAIQWRHRYEAWRKEQADAWNWRAWLPDKYRRVGICETGLNWSFDSGTYVSAFGIIRVAFPSWNGHNSPREQYEVAQSIHDRYGWSAWGCGGA